MSPTPIVIVFLTLLVGGSVANVADRLGRRIGKKKLTMFGKRPKTTAQILTTLSGMLIGLVVFGVVYAFSTPVRKWMAEGPAILEERDALRNQKATLSKDLVDMRSEQDQVRAESEKLKKNQAVLITQQKSLTERVVDLGKKASENEAKLKLNQAKLAESTRRVTELKQRQSSLEAQRKTLLKAKEEVQMQLSRKQISLVTAEAKFTEIDRKLVQVTAQSNAATEQLNSIQEQNLQLTRENTSLEHDRAAALAAKSSAEEALAKRIREIDEKIIAKQAELDQAQQAIATYQDVTDYYLFAPVIFSRGDELVRHEVPPMLTRGQAENLLNGMFVDAEEAAKERGALANKNFPIVTLITARNPATNQKMSAAGQFEAAIMRLTESKDDQVIVFRSATNSFAGKPVAVAIQLAQNPIIYRQGQIIGEARINGRQTEQEILQQINQFINTEISEKVRRAGMLPRTGSNGGVGEVSALAILELVRDIKTRDQLCRIYARAESATRAAGPLKLVFQVR